MADDLTMLFHDVVIITTIKIKSTIAMKTEYLDKQINL